jgi:hypothetical protein
MRFRCLAFTAMVLLPTTARADFFNFNATTDPMTLSYLPVGSGHYNYPGASESVSGSSAAHTSQFFGTTNVEFGGANSLRDMFPKTSILLSRALVLIPIPATASISHGFFRRRTAPR